MTTKIASIQTHLGAFLGDSHLMLPRMTKRAAVAPVVAPAVPAAKPSMAYRAGKALGSNPTIAAGAQFAKNRVSEIPAKAKGFVAGTKKELKTIGNVVKPVAQAAGNNLAESFKAPDPTLLTTHNEAAHLGGIHPLLQNMTGGRGAMLGAGVGAALGALSPGKDEDGEDRGMVSGMIHGGLKGGLVGGAAGAVANHGFVQPAVANNWGQAAKNVAAGTHAASTPAASTPAASTPAASTPAASTPAPVTGAAPGFTPSPELLRLQQRENPNETLMSGLGQPQTANKQIRRKKTAGLNFKFAAPLPGPRALHPAIPKPAPKSMKVAYLKLTSA